MAISGSRDCMRACVTRAFVAVRREKITCSHIPSSSGRWRTTKEEMQESVVANPYLASLVSAVGSKRGGAGSEGADREQVLLPRVVILRVPHIIRPRRARPELAVGLPPVTAKP